MSETYKPLPKDPLRHREALSEIEQGRQCVASGDMAAAKTWFEKSLETYPTAEGYTFVAWMVSFEHRFDEAIEYCKKAIELDPEFGNPYNDLGAYLIAKGALDEAVPWLEKAKVAPRYDARHFPYTNLGRLYLKKGWLKKASEELTKGLEMSPGNPEIEYLLGSAEQGLN